MKKYFPVFLILITLLSGCEKKSETDTNEIPEQTAAISQADTVSTTQTESKSFINSIWLIDLSIYDDVPDDIFISSITIHLNKEDYTLGYHFQGGPFASGTYKVDGDKIYIDYPSSFIYESDTYSYLLNKIFPNKENQIFTYDSDYKSLGYCGCITNGTSIFSDNSNPSPVNEVYDFEGIPVIKLERFDAYSRETMKLRKAPSTTAEVGTFNYEIDEYNYGTEEYRLAADQDRQVPYLLAGKILSVSLKTVTEEEIDGIKAPWYRITVWGGPEDIGHSFWIWGGYMENWPEIEDAKKLDEVHALFEKEALRLKVAKKVNVQ